MVCYQCAPGTLSPRRTPRFPVCGTACSLERVTNIDGEEDNAQIDELRDARLGLSRSLAPLTRPRFSVRAPPPVASIALVPSGLVRAPSMLCVGSRKTRQQETHNKTSTDNKKSTTSRHAQQLRHARQPLYTASHSTRCFTQPESAASAADRVRRQPRRWSWSRSASCVTGAPNRIG